MADSTAANLGEQERPEDDTRPECKSPRVRQAAAVPSPTAREMESPSHAHFEPAKWVYYTFFVLSITQLVFCCCVRKELGRNAVLVDIQSRQSSES